MEADPPAPWMDLGSLICGSSAAGWSATSMLGVALPAWPAASLGLFARLLAWPTGRAAPRAIGAFLGLVGLVIAALQIAVLWGVLGGLGA